MFLNKRLPHAMTLTIIALLIMALTPAISVAAMQEWRITNNTAVAVLSADVSGDRIAWGQSSGTKQEVFVRNTRTGSQQRVFSANGSGFGVSVALSGDKLVFTWGDSEAAKVYLHDLSTGRQKRLSISADLQSPADVDGVHVAWGEYNGSMGTSRILLYDISTGVAARELMSGRPRRTSVSVGGNKVVWIENLGSAGYKVVSYDIASSALQDIVLNNNRILTASTDGFQTVWEQIGPNSSQVWAFSYASASRRQVSNSAYFHVAPDVHNGKVAWQAWSPSGETSKIFLYDLTNNVRREVRSMPNIVYGIKVSGNRIVWADDRYGSGVSTDLFLGNISGIDTKPPTARMITASYSTRTSKNATFKISWAGSDPAPSEGGVVAYDIQIKSGQNGTWKGFRTRTAARSAYVTGRPGHTYYLRARAIDAVGIRGSWSTERYTVVPDDDTAMTPRSGFSGAEANASSENFLGTLRYSLATSETVDYAFRGSSVAIITDRAPNRSEANVYIDGVLAAKIDTYAPSLTPRQVVFRKVFGGVGNHTVSVENVGTTGRKRLDIDGIGITR